MGGSGSLFHITCFSLAACHISFPLIWLSKCQRNLGNMKYIWKYTAFEFKMSYLLAEYQRWNVTGTSNTSKMKWVSPGFFFTHCLLCCSSWQWTHSCCLATSNWPWARRSTSSLLLTCTRMSLTFSFTFLPSLEELGGAELDDDQQKIALGSCQEVGFYNLGFFPVVHTVEILQFLLPSRRVNVLFYDNISSDSYLWFEGSWNFSELSDLMYKTSYFRLETYVTLHKMIKPCKYLTHSDRCEERFEYLSHRRHLLTFAVCWWRFLTDWNDHDQKMVKFLIFFSFLFTHLTAVL